MPLETVHTVVILAIVYTMLGVATSIAVVEGRYGRFAVPRWKRWGLAWVCFLGAPAVWLYLITGYILKRLTLKHWAEEI